MKIQLKEWRVKNLALTSRQGDLAESNANDSFKLSFGHSFPKENNHEFIIGFKIGLGVAAFDLQMEMIFSFATDHEIDEDFRDSYFLKVNAPAIAFPYIRSYISTLTLQSGYPTIILPSINFVALNDKPSE